MKKLIIPIVGLLMIITSCEKENADKQLEYTPETPKPGCFIPNSMDTLPPLESKWVFLGFNNGKTWEEKCGPAEVGDLTISFEIGNKMKAANPCNYFEGVYAKTICDSLLSIDSLSTTFIYCTNNALMQWEKDYFAALSTIEGYKIEGDLLTLKTSSEFDLVFRFVSKNVPYIPECFMFENGDTNKDLFGVDWFFVGHVDVLYYCKPLSVPDIKIRYSIPNTFSGFAGCNHVWGTVEVDNNFIQTTQLGSTMMNCNAIMWEYQYKEWLREIVEYKIEGQRLTLITESGLKLIFRAE